MRLVNRNKSEFTASVNVEIPSDETDSKGLSIRLFLLSYQIPMQQTKYTIRVPVKEMYSNEYPPNTERKSKAKSKEIGLTLTDGDGILSS